MVFRILARYCCWESLLALSISSLFCPTGKCPLRKRINNVSNSSRRIQIRTLFWDSLTLCILTPISLHQQTNLPISISLCICLFSSKISHITIIIIIIKLFVIHSRFKWTHLIFKFQYNVYMQNSPLTFFDIQKVKRSNHQNNRLKCIYDLLSFFIFFF